MQGKDKDETIANTHDGGVPKEKAPPNDELPTLDDELPTLVEPSDKIFHRETYRPSRRNRG